VRRHGKSRDAVAAQAGATEMILNVRRIRRMRVEDA
jgi:hypothetical protein